MQGISNEIDFYNTLVCKIYTKLEFNTNTTNTTNIKVSNFREFKLFMKKDIKPILKEKIIVLMIDKFEILQKLIEEKKISKIILSNLRHLMQHEEKLIFILCGTHKLKDLRVDYFVS